MQPALLSSMECAVYIHMAVLVKRSAVEGLFCLKVQAVPLNLSSGGPSELRAGCWAQTLSGDEQGVMSSAYCTNAYAFSVVQCCSVLLTGTGVQHSGTHPWCSQRGLHSPAHTCSDTISQAGATQQTCKLMFCGGAVDMAMRQWK